MAKREASATVDLKVRMKEPLRAALESAAKSRGVSMNAEAVDRLERSFAGEETAEAMLGGPEVFGIVQIVGRALHETGRMAGFMKLHTLEGANAWFLDPYAYDQAVRAVHRVLEALRPDGPVTAPKPNLKGVAGPEVGVPLEEIFARLGEGFANEAVAAVSSEDGGATQESKEWGRKVRAKLGKAAGNLKGGRHG